jgi:hypothetical protein
MLTEADDYAWVPLGDVLLALMDPEAGDLAYPEFNKDGTPAKSATLDTLRRLDHARDAGDAERGLDVARAAFRAHLKTERDEWAAMGERGVTHMCAWSDDCHAKIAALDTGSDSDGR